MRIRFATLTAREAAQQQVEPRHFLAEFHHVPRAHGFAELGVVRFDRVPLHVRRIHALEPALLSLGKPLDRNSESADAAAQVHESYRLIFFGSHGGGGHWLVGGNHFFKTRRESLANRHM
jgi:hypothetical protein